MKTVMNTRLWFLVVIAIASGADRLAGQAETWEPRRINKVIELWEMGEPVYYTGCGECDYEAGLRLARTPADYIDYAMEHTATDIPRLREFMRGLVDGGPTRSGHRTPAVIVSTPAVGWTETAMRGNTHVMQYILAAGAHGILLTHAVDPAAVRILVESIRYPFAPPVVGLGQGMRGAGSAGAYGGAGSQGAAAIWGIPTDEYLIRADVWPINPNGETLVGLKIENVHAVEQAQYTVRVPGVAFAEWGPGDQSYWLGGILGLGRPAPSDHPKLLEYRQRVVDAVRSVDIKFLDACNADNVIERLDEGVMICTGGAGPGAEIGRRHTERQMPW
jgi:4-hydroxy-2-oxoheptanedioate aldolase